MIIKISKTLIIKSRGTKGNWTRKIAQTEIENASITSLSRLPDVILALKSGKVEGVVVEKPVAEAYLKQNPKLGISNVKFNEEEKIQW